MKKSQFFSLMKLRRPSVASVAGMGVGGHPRQSYCLWKNVTGT